MQLRTASTTFVIEVGDAVVTVKPLSASESSRLREKHTRPPKRGEIIPGFDSNAMTKELFCQVVRDWQNIDGQDGEPLPCDDVTKIKIYEHNAAFARDVLAMTDEKSEALQEVAGKN